ncbi:unnamed protein product [Malus baccata var. baccata]
MTTLTPSCTPCSRKTQSPSKPLIHLHAQLGETKKITSGESDGFRGHFQPNHGELAGVQDINIFVSSSNITFLFELYSFESYPVFGDLRGFRGNFRPNHCGLDWRGFPAEFPAFFFLDNQAFQAIRTPRALANLG